MWSRYLVIMLVSSWLAACSQTIKTVEKSDPIGTYTLVSIDGHVLPYAPTQEGPGGPEVISSTLRLNDDGTFHLTISFRVNNGKSSNSDMDGTYTKDGTRYEMKWRGRGVTIGNVEDGAFTFKNEGALFRYEK